MKHQVHYVTTTILLLLLYHLQLSEGMCNNYS